MINNPKCMLCSGDIRSFRTVNNNNNNKIELLDRSNHPEQITWATFKNIYRNTKQIWFYNGPLFCFRKSAVMKVGNYNPNLRSGEDGELFVRILKEYGFICNIKTKRALLLYRIHNNNTSTSSNIYIYDNILQGIRTILFTL